MNVEQTLRALEPAWPATPDMAAAVAARIEPRRRSFAVRRTLVVAFATLLLAGTAIAGRALFDGNVEVREVPKLPPATAKLELGPRLSLAAAERRAGFAPPHPAGFDRFYAEPGEFTAVSGGLLFSAIRGDLPLQFVEKLLGPGTTARRVAVGEASGIWIEGKPHIFIVRRSGNVIEEAPLRLAKNTLLWPRGDLVLRIEGAKTIEDALRLAATVR